MNCPFETAVILRCENYITIKLLQKMSDQERRGWAGRIQGRLGAKGSGRLSGGSLSEHESKAGRGRQGGGLGRGGECEGWPQRDAGCGAQEPGSIKCLG